MWPRMEAVVYTYTSSQRANTFLLVNGANDENILSNNNSNNDDDDVDDDSNNSRAH